MTLIEDLNHEILLGIDWLPPRPPPADNWCKNDREEFAKLNTLLAQVRRARREDAG